MHKNLFLLFFLLMALNTTAQYPPTPDQLYGELFTDVQLGRIFPDSKTFVDCTPRKDPKAIVSDYLALKNNPAVRYSLKLFVEQNFFIPQDPPSDYKSSRKNLLLHINQLWEVLRRKSDKAVAGSSVLPLPFDYIIPGGRFREIYYWDSYFTMLGLKESRKNVLVENMVKNFSYLINTYGHMPNGNRSYYLSRSQPPFFSLMLDLLASVKGMQVYATYLPALEREYCYWMDSMPGTQHKVTMPDGSILNRYWDQLTIPRQESYLEDVKVAEEVDPSQHATLFRDIRSAAESGWDFSSRWLKDGKHMRTIHTTQIIPVDLNCLLYHMELMLAVAYRQKGDAVREQFYIQTAEARRRAINRYCWSPEARWFMDYDLSEKRQSPSLTLAGMFPFFFKVADKGQFAPARRVLEERFLKPGGVVTTVTHTSEQWDSPNGWAPLQWITIRGLEQYGDRELASRIAKRWIALNKRVYESTGKLMEKYDVVEANKTGGGGEYPAQDGFGWTNGVLIALIQKYGLTK